MELNGPGKLLTIGIPNYNYGSYLQQTIDSVLCQPGEDFEVLIADNHSTDNSWNIISSYNDSRIRIVRHEKNLGFHANWNYVLSHARGKYFVLLPSDDFLAPDFLQNFRTALNQVCEFKPGTVLWGYGNVLEENSNIIYPAIPAINNEYAIESVSSFAFKSRHFSPPWAHAQQTHLLRQLGGYKNGSRRLDSLLYFDALCADSNGHILVIKKPLAFQRIHKLNERNSIHAQIIIDNIELAVKILEIEKNIFNRTRLSMFLSKNYMALLMVRNRPSKLMNVPYISLSNLMRVSVCAPLVILISVMDRCLPFPPFSSLKRFIAL